MQSLSSQTIKSIEEMIQYHKEQIGDLKFSGLQNRVKKHEEWIKVLKSILDQKTDIQKKNSGSWDTICGLKV